MGDGGPITGLLPMLPGGWPTALLVMAVVALLWPVPRLLERAAWVNARPRAALATWAVCGLASGVGLVASTLCFVHCLLSSRWLARDSRAASDLLLGARGSGEGGVWAGVLAAGVLACWLLTCLVVTSVGLARRRRRHVATLRLVGDWRPELHAVVVDGRTALAYCVPGLWRSTIVVSRGCVQVTDDAELAAILEHERAHARGRHDVLITAFVAWQRALPFLPAARSAVPAVRAVTELIADEAAARRVGAQPTVAAIHRLQTALAPQRVHSADQRPAPDPLGRRVRARAGRGPAPVTAAARHWEPDAATMRRVRRLLARRG